MRKIILLLCLVTLAAGLSLCSCELFAKEETVDFELPQWPDYLPELQGWEVTCSGAALRQAQGPRVLSKGPDAKTITLRLDKNIPCCIIVTPITEVPFFKPAGTIYPYSQKITWSGGYAAYLFKIIPESEQFNWEKLLGTLETCDNPWLLNSQQVLEGIAYCNFNANKLKLSGAIIVQLDFDVFSSYVPENLVIQKNKTVTVIKNQPELFVLRQDSGTYGFEFGLIISASSAKNISLDLVSMPIIKEGL